jgi:membrane protease YdiL (CAAX protease family)
MEEKVRFPSVRDAFILVIGTLLLFMLISLFLAGGTHKIQLLILEAALVVPVILFVLIKKIPLTVFRLNPAPVRLIILSLVISVSFSMLSAELGVWIQKIRPMSPQIEASIRELMTIRTVWDAVLLIAGAVVIAAVTEEMLFRGFFQTTLERTGSAGRAIGIGAFVFAMLHFNPWWFPEIILMGVVLGILSWRSRSILPCIFVHMVSNGLSLFIVNMESAFDWMHFDASIPPAWLVLAGLAFAGSMILFYRWTDPVRKRKHEYSIIQEEVSL